MSAICRFCDQEFANAQAVRAHLKACTAYRNRRPDQALGSRALGNTTSGGAALGSVMPLGSHGQDGGTGPIPDGNDFDPVRQLERQVAAERLRLTLREVEDAHAELDRKTEAKERERKQEEERYTNGKRAAEEDARIKQNQSEQERRERERREAAAQQRRERRRQVIQDIKEKVMAEASFRMWGIPDANAEALQEIERALSPLPVDELPYDELVTIARVARDQVLRAAGEAKREADEAALQAEHHNYQMAERKQRLIRQGLEYVKRELKAVDDLSSFEAWRIQLRIERELQEITGDEPWSDIVDQIEDILESECIEDLAYDDDN